MSTQSQLVATQSPRLTQIVRPGQTQNVAADWDALAQDQTVSGPILHKQGELERQAEVIFDVKAGSQGRFRSQR
jgi:hypothetical protein